MVAGSTWGGYPRGAKVGRAPYLALPSPPPLHTTVTGGGARAICLWDLAALFSPLFFFPTFKRNKGEKRKNKNKKAL